MIGNAMMDPIESALVLPSRAPAPPPRVRPLRSASGEDLLQAVGSAEDLRAGLAAAVRLLRRDYPVEGVQWWTRAVEDAALRVELSCGEASGPRVSVSAGAAGTIVLIG